MNGACTAPAQEGVCRSGKCYDIEISAQARVVTPSAPVATGVPLESVAEELWRKKKADTI